MRLSRDHHSLQLRLTRDIVSVWFGVPRDRSDSLEGALLRIQVDRNVDYA
jgi:hypothetical protein